MRRWLSAAPIGAVLLTTLTGCSAALALSQYGERTEPHPLQAGEARRDVELRLGHPASLEVYDDGSRRATYREKVAKISPFWSHPPWHRAMHYILGDVGTLGLLELFGTPLELGGKIYRAVNSTTYLVTVVYDADERVVEFSRRPTSGQRPGDGSR